MQNIQWIFSGIGTEILTLLIGGIAGYKIGVKKSYIQSQKADDDSKQMQELSDSDDVDTNKKTMTITKNKQSQKAGKRSEQSQVGRIRNGKW